MQEAPNSTRSAGMASFTSDTVGAYCNMFACLVRTRLLYRSSSNRYFNQATQARENYSEVEAARHGAREIPN